MFKRFLPKEYSFFDYFDKQIAIDVKMSEEFLGLWGREVNFEDFAKRIKEMELEADKVTIECSEALHKTFITPFERTDVHALSKRLDDIADNMNAAAQCMLIYDIKELRSEIKELSEILNGATKELVLAVKGLRNMKDTDKIRQSCYQVHELENRADEINRYAVNKLFKEGDALEINKWKEVFERMERAVDRCEDLANVIERVLIDNA
jgi:uncharacterized protein Yka (UPF0111/DUF47 family)